MTNYRLVLHSQPQHRFCELEVNARISNCPIAHVMMPFDRLPWFQEVGQVGTTLLKKLSEIDGVEQVFLKPYGMSVHAAKVFDWLPIEDAIIKTFEEVLEVGEIEVIGRTPRNDTGVIPFKR